MAEKQAVGTGVPAARQMVAQLALALALGIGAAHAEGPDVESTLWDLRTLAPGKVYPTTITAVNASCRGPQTVVVLLEGLPWFRVTGPTEFPGLRPGDTRTSSAEVDTRGLAPGYYQGWIRLKCTTCPAPPKCVQDLHLLEVVLRIPGPEIQPPRESPESGTDSSDPADPGNSGSDPEPSEDEQPVLPPTAPPALPEELCGALEVEGRFAPTQVVWQDDPVFQDQPTKQLKHLNPTLLEAELDMVKDRQSLLFGTIRPVGARAEQKRRTIFVRGTVEGTTAIPVKFRFWLSNGGPRRLLWESPVVDRIPIGPPCRPGDGKRFEVNLETPEGVPADQPFRFSQAGGYTLTAELITESGTSTGIQVRAIGNVAATKPIRVFFQPIVLAADVAEADRETLREATQTLEQASGLHLPDWYPLATAPLPTRTLQVRVMTPTAADRAAAERFKREFPTEDAGGVMRYVLNEAVTRQLQSGGAFDDADRIVAVLGRADFNRFRTGDVARAGAFTNSQKVTFIDKDVAPYAHTVAHELAHTLPFAWTTRDIERECKRSFHNDDRQNVAHGFEITLATEVNRRWIEGGRPLMGRSHPERAAITQCTYWHLLKQLIEGPPDPPVILVQGYLLNGSSGVDGVLLPAYQFDSVVDLAEGDEGDWAILLRNAKGKKLGRFPFSPTFEYPHGGERPVLAFAHRVPDVAGTARIDLVGPKRVVDSLAYSDHPPAVEIAAPEPVDGRLLVEWTGSDADGDDLLYAVLYSSDGEETWATLAFEQTESSFELELDSGRTEHAVRVVVTDGARSGEARIAFRTPDSEAGR